MTNNSVPSHVPEESRKEMANYLKRVTAEWIKSNNSAIHSGDEKILVKSPEWTSKPNVWQIVDKNEVESN